MASVVAHFLLAWTALRIVPSCCCTLKTKDLLGTTFSLLLFMLNVFPLERIKETESTKVKRNVYPILEVKRVREFLQKKKNQERKGTEFKLHKHPVT